MIRRASRILVAVFATASVAGDFRAGALTISDAWTRPAAAGMAVGVAYFTLRNDGATDEILVAASTPVAAHVEFHRTTLTDGMARMRPLKEVVVPAKGTVVVSPGGIHLMLTELKGPLVTGTRVPMTLEFRNAGRVSIELRVETRSE